MRAQNIYDLTMSLMDERKDNGEVDTSSTRDYNARVPGILTILQNEIALRLGIDALDEITALGEDIDLEDDICSAVIPYGLASRLLAQEDTALSNYFSSLFELYLNNFINKYKEKSKQVKRTDVYSSSMRVGD